MQRKGQTPRRGHFSLVVNINRLHQAIRGGRGPSLDELARLLECGPRNAKRYLQRLRNELQAPLIYDREQKGYRYRDPGWELPPFEFSEGELLAFFLAERVLKQAGHTPEAELLRTALRKVAALLPERISVNPANIGEALSFEPPPRVMVEPAHLNTLARVIAEQRTIQILYHTQSRNQTLWRKIDALHLHNFAGDWYVVAFDHLRQSVRDFHVGRVKSLKETPDYFTPPGKWDAAEYLRRGFAMMRGGQLTTVSLVFDAYQSRYMRERQAFHPEESREELPGGGLRLTFAVGRNGLDAVARFCLTYAGHCRAEQPAALREMVRERLRNALEQHQ
jgi:predicted DNA-binding transcriptional regulator YafY